MGRTPTQKDVKAMNQSIEKLKTYKSDHKRHIKLIPDKQVYLAMKVPGISGGWILMYLSNATKRTRTPRGGKNAYRGQERLSTGKVTFTHNRQKFLPKKRL